MGKFIVMILTIFIFSGCSTKEVEEDVFKYKDSPIGDNSAIGNIIHGLTEGEHVEGFELKTRENPYGIVVNYDGMEDEEAAVYYATYLFTLVTNVEWVSIHFNDTEITLTKSELQDWYGKEFETIKSEEEIEELLHNYSEDWDDIVEATK